MVRKLCLCASVWERETPARHLHHRWWLQYWDLEAVQNAGWFKRRDLLKPFANAVTLRGGDEAFTVMAQKVTVQDRNGRQSKIYSRTSAEEECPFSLSFSFRDEWRKISSVTVKKWVEWNGVVRETNSGAGQGLGKNKKRKERKQKEGVEWAEATQTGQTESQRADGWCCHFPSAVAVTRATHQLDPDLILLTLSFKKPFLNQH